MFHNYTNILTFFPPSSISISLYPHIIWMSITVLNMVYLFPRLKRKQMGICLMSKSMYQTRRKLVSSLSLEIQMVDYLIP